MKWCLISLLILLPVSSIAQVRLSEVFSDNMVLQRGKPVHVWGKSAPGKMIMVAFAGKTETTVTKPDSVWSFFLPAQTANIHSQSLTVSSGDDKIVLQNILIGDIWVCVGQSNMEWPMFREQHWKEEIHNSNQPNIRLLNPPPAGRNVFGVPFTDSLINRLTTEKFYDWNGWQQCDSSSVKLMSAVAYYFAKNLYTETGVPVGIINLSIGGAPLETFIGAETLSHHAIFNKKVNGNWLSNDALPVWVKERGKQNVGNSNKIPGDEWGPNHAYKPGIAFEAGIKPLLQMPVNGILCYQGESNAQEMERVNEYADLSALMVSDYRKKWNQPKLPFYFVQLSSIDTVKYKGQLWPQFRDEQRKMLQLIPNSGMAVCSDIGAKDDVHPTNKKDVGERLARWALNKTYGQKIVPSGPLPVKAIFSKGKVIVSFEYMAKGLKTTDGTAIRGFSIDGKNESAASFGDSGIIIPVNSKPQYIYYGWKPFSNGNLINSEDLPASTFKLIVK